MKTPDTCNNMVEATQLIHEASRAHFGLNNFNGIQRLIARRAGLEDAYNAEKAQAEQHYMNERSAWEKEYCKANFSRFQNTQVYKILMGIVEPPAGTYYYVPLPL